MPESQGKKLPYTNREACIQAAKQQGVDSGPCMRLPAQGGGGVDTKGPQPNPRKPKPLGKVGGGGMGY